MEEGQKTSKNVAINAISSAANETHKKRTVNNRKRIEIG